MGWPSGVPLSRPQVELLDVRELQPLEVLQAVQLCSELLRGKIALSMLLEPHGQATFQ